MFEQIEKLKQELTDKYVVVDAKVPELKRFQEFVGIVKTVNMSGRALVEFLDFNANIAWFDIDLSFLKVVDKPLEKKPEAKEKPAKPATPKPAVEKEAAPAGAKKPSVAEIMAAARTKSGAASATDAKSPAAPAAKKPSTADILAAARGKAAASGTAAPTPVAKKETPPPATAIEEPVVEEAAPVVAPAGAKKAPAGALPKTTAEILAFCRKVDAK